MRVPFQRGKKVRKGNDVTAVESTTFKPFFLPIHSIPWKGCDVVLKFLELFRRAKRRGPSVWFSNRKPLNTIYGNEHQELALIKMKRAKWSV